ncbi:helix-turn-helix domain-containing protein [Streptomyces sp. NPDC059788]|uniref:helix-turn-helix domain-containing protein n=1 Tax=Streptomyces sp. NPDC059788 TaxID=3346948 RepID=UPI0036688F82
MSPELGSGRTGRGPDRLALLDNVPEGPRKVLVARLRTLREASGLTLEQLRQGFAEQGVVLSVSRLSKFLNGHEIPSRAQIAAFHQVCDAEPETARAQEAVRTTQKMLYAVVDAERERKPLRAREFDVEEAREQQELLRVEAAAELGTLREELEHERDLRRKAEEALQRLAEQAGDHAREIGELTRERDAARGRVAELEDAIAQGEAVVRLRRSEVRHLDEMVAETAREIARYEGTAAPTAPSTAPRSVTDLFALVEKLRDEDRDATADNAVATFCDESPEGIPALWEEFREHGRKLDAERLLAAAARICGGVQLYHLCRTGTFRRTAFILDTEVVTGDHLIDSIGGEAPVGELARFGKACHERDDQEALGFLAAACQNRPEAAVRDYYRERDLRMNALSPGRPRPRWQFWR